MQGFSVLFVDLGQNSTQCLYSTGFPCYLHCCHVYAACCHGRGNARALGAQARWGLLSCCQAFITI